MDKLSDFGAKNVRDSYLKGFPDREKRGGGPKMRYNFIIEDQE